MRVGVLILLPDGLTGLDATGTAVLVGDRITWLPGTTICAARVEDTGAPPLHVTPAEAVPIRTVQL